MLCPVLGGAGLDPRCTVSILPAADPDGSTTTFAASFGNSSCASEPACDPSRSPRVQVRTLTCLASPVPLSRGGTHS